MKKGLWAKASAFALAAAIGPQLAVAQDSAADVLRDEVFVTAQKKAEAENVQDVPLAVTAYGDKQLDALKVRDLGNLSYKMPNVQLEDIGTSRGIANFSIRGLGINSSIPSIDPAVGTFVDGVYLGQNGGVVLDIFDLESIEVLRGPQGILFGRNVTGGAVLINTKRPNLEEFEASAKFAVDSGLRGTGLNYYAMGSVSGPLIKDSLALKLSAYYNRDKGWFKNYLGGPNLVARVAAIGGTPAALQGLGYPIAVNKADAFADFGEAETWMVRPSLLWAPSDNVELLIRYEHGDSTGDGPAAQNHPGFRAPYDTAAGAPIPPAPSVNAFFTAPKDSFTFSIDEPGFYNFEWDAVTAELNIDVPFGDGRITNIFGWRDSSGSTRSDIDATPFWLFHAGSISEYDQISNELRYAGRFWDRVNTTVGFYYFTSDNAYEEQRFLLGNRQTFFGGGIQDARQYGVFGQLEFDLSETFSLIGGVRYTNEKKSVDIFNLVPPFTNAPPPAAIGQCSIYTGSCGVDFSETRTWENITPKAGFQWDVRDWFNLYGHWTEGVRSGGYNFRNTAAAIPIQGFDEEEVDTFELGFKAQPADGKATINFAVFRTSIDDMQREVNLPDAVAGVVQLIRNTADANIFGIELEAQYAVTDNLVIMGNLGRLDGEYEEVFFNLNSDFRDITTGTAATTGVQNLPLDTDILDVRDLQLQIPRLAPWTYGMGFVHSMDLSDMFSVDTRFNWSHRDDNAYTDNNLGILQGADMIDATIALNIGTHAIFSIYGQNLLNEVTHGGETQLPTALGGGSFAPLNKGRVVGLELQLKL
jgi:iron complex outermembrane receptor protein